MEVKLCGVNVYYEKTGVGKRPVILLHGWGQNTIMMKPVADNLGGSFTVYNIDFPGFGQSEEPKEAWGIPEYSAMLEEFVKVMNIDDPILIAHSFGVRVSLYYAQSHKLSKMIFTGGAGIRPKRSLMYYIRVYTYKLFKIVLSIPGLSKVKARLMKNAGSEDYKALTGVMRESFVKIVNLDLSYTLKDIDSEVLLVWGEHDDATPLWMGKKMEKEMPNAGLAIFENEGHYAYWNQMDRFLNVINIFLEEDKL